MKEVKAVKRRVQVVRAVTCNKCGELCKDLIPGQFEFAALTTNWGYGSSRDGESEESHLCESCYSAVVSGFKIPPTSTK